MQIHHSDAQRAFFVSDLRLLVTKHQPRNIRHQKWKKQDANVCLFIYLQAQFQKHQQAFGFNSNSSFLDRICVYLSHQYYKFMRLKSALSYTDYFISCRLWVYNYDDSHHLKMPQLANQPGFHHHIDAIDYKLSQMIGCQARNRTASLKDCRITHQKVDLKWTFSFF